MFAARHGDGRSSRAAPGALQRRESRRLRRARLGLGMQQPTRELTAATASTQHSGTRPGRASQLFPARSTGRKCNDAGRSRTCAHQRNVECAQHAARRGSPHAGEAAVRGVARGAGAAQAARLRRRSARPGVGVRLISSPPPWGSCRTTAATGFAGSAPAGVAAGAGRAERGGSAPVQRLRNSGGRAQAHAAAVAPKAPPRLTPSRLRRLPPAPARARPQRRAALGPLQRNPSPSCGMQRPAAGSERTSSLADTEAMPKPTTARTPKATAVLRLQ